MQTIRSGFLVTGAVALLFGAPLAGCGTDQVAVHGAAPNAPATAMPTATATATPPPDEHHGPPHTLMRIGSTEPSGGTLVVDGVPTAYVVASACLGGTGEECEGGTVVYTGDSPGFNSLTADDPAAPIYVLPDGVEVRIEVTAVHDASVMVSEVMLDMPGETAVVNTTPHLHNHPTWQLVAPGGTHPADGHISFRLHADGYEPSNEITVTVQLFDEHDDEHGHD